MNEKPKILLIPAYFTGADKGCVQNSLTDVRNILDNIGVDHTQTLPLSDIDTSAVVKGNVRNCEYDLVLLFLVGWIDPNVAVDLLIDLKDKPILIWSLDYFRCKQKKSHLGTLAGFISIKGSLEQIGIKFTYLYGNTNKSDLTAELTDIVAAAQAVTQIRKSRLGMVGYTALGMYPAMAHPLEIKKTLGTEIVPIDNHTLINLCNTACKAKDMNKNLDSFRKIYSFTTPLEEKDEKMCLAMTEAIRQLVAANNLSAITLRCCFELAIDFGFAPCVPLSILSNEFVTSCESDIPVTLSQLMLHYVTGQPAAYVDILMMEDFRIYCACCGFGAFEYARSKKCIAYSTAGKGDNDLTYRRLTNSSGYEDGIYTLARLRFSGEDRVFLQVILGENKNDFEPFYELGCENFPSLGLIVKQNTSKLLEKLESQHFAIIKGNVVKKLKYLCKFMGIEMQIFS